MVREVRAIIAGGRDFSNYSLLSGKVFDIIGQYADVTIISGHAKGADELGEIYAKKYNIPVKIFSPDWEEYSRATGPIRNREMAKYASEGDSYSILIAFWDGKSKGTKSMIDLGLKYLKEVHVIKY